MKVYEGLDAEKRLVYFEVPNAFFSRRAASKLVSRIPGVSVLSMPSFLPFGGDDVFCRFELGGRRFELWEPFGDNSRFHIAAKPLEPCGSLDQLRLVFQKHQPMSSLMRWFVLLTGAVLIWLRFVRH
jgi:hypothetical protein